MAKEDYTTYTEVDTVNDRIQKTAHHIDFVSSRNAEETYLYKDYGVDHFGDFTHKVDVVQTAGSWVGYAWGLSNTVDELLDCDPRIGIYFYYASGANSTINLIEYSGAQYKDSFGPFSLNTPYYLLIKKTGTSLKCGIYSTAELRDAGDATDGDIDNLALTLQADHKFRYVFGCSSFTLTSAGTGTFDIDALDLQEGAIKTSSATLAGTGTLTAAATIVTEGVVYGEATMSGTGSLAALGSYLHSATATLAGTGSLSAQGGVLKPGAASLSGTREA